MKRRHVWLTLAALVVAAAALFALFGPYRETAPRQAVEKPSEPLSGAAPPTAEGLAADGAADGLVAVAEEEIFGAPLEGEEDSTPKETIEEPEGVPIEEYIAWLHSLSDEQRQRLYEQNLARAEAHSAVMDAVLGGISKKRRKAIAERPPYHVAEAELKETLRTKYGKITQESIGKLVEKATALEEEFWERGDFDDVSNMDIIYEARALLGLILDADPKHEGALRQLCEVIQAGWPCIKTWSDDRETIAFEYWQRRYDLFIPMRTLWKEHLSKRPAATPEDMNYAYDLVTFAWTLDDEKRKSDALEAFEKLNPNPSVELAQLVRNGWPIDDKLAIARWARDGAATIGGRWTFYSTYFDACIKWLESGADERGYVLSAYFVTQGGEPGIIENLRFTSGRGRSFVGPETRRESLVPFVDSDVKMVPATWWDHWGRGN